MGSCRADTLRIGGFVDTSTVDWYSNVSLVVFFAGCNFRCPYCQNASLIPLDSGRTVGLQLLKERVDANQTLLDSVVFTGGEPLMQPAPLLEAAKIVKNSKLKLMLNTNGSVQEVVEKIVEEDLLDRLALDVKAPLTTDDYGRVAGLPHLGADLATSVNETLNICNKKNIDVEVRTTVVPSLSDYPDFIKSIATSIRGRCDAYYLQQFDNSGDILDPAFKKVSPPSKDELISLARVAIDVGVRDVYVKTRESGLQRIG